MWPLASAFVDIALHRRGPQDLPASDFLVGLLLVSYFIVGLAVVGIAAPGGSTVLFMLVDGVVYYLGFVWLVLSLYKRRPRFRQTVSALLGADIFLSLLGIPLLLWNRAIGAGQAEPTVPTFLYLALFLWSIDVAGYVLSQALERPYIAGVLIVILYVMTSMILGDLLNPSGG